MGRTRRNFGHLRSKDIARVPVASWVSDTNHQMAGVVILGMHRSGTSAVAGFLAKAGFFAGEAADLLEAAEDNPKGFFERADVNALNDNFLAELDGAWDRPPGRDADPRTSRLAP